MKLNPNYEFICHITGCGPDLQPDAYHSYRDAWVKLAETDKNAKNGRQDRSRRKL